MGRDPPARLKKISKNNRDLVKEVEKREEPMKRVREVAWRCRSLGVKLINATLTFYPFDWILAKTSEKLI